MKEYEKVLRALHIKENKICLGRIFPPRINTIYWGGEGSAGIGLNERN